MVRDTVGKYAEEEFYWSDEFTSAGAALFDQAEEFTRPFLEHLDALKKDHESGENPELVLVEIWSAHRTLPSSSIRLPVCSATSQTPPFQYSRQN